MNEAPAKQKKTKRVSFILSEEAQKIVQAQSDALGVNKTGVIELALRAFNAPAERREEA